MKFIILFLFSLMPLKTWAIDGFKAESFMFGKHKMSAEVFKEDTYFIHLRNITSPDFVTKVNTKGKYRFDTSKSSLAVGDKFCKSILGAEFKQVMTDTAGMFEDDPFKAELREIRCQREKTAIEIMRAEAHACSIFRKPTTFAPNCPDYYAKKKRINDDDRSTGTFKGDRAPAIVENSAAHRR